MDLNFEFEMSNSTMSLANYPNLRDVKGNVVDLKVLATQFQLVLITMKSTTCAACPQLLRILNMLGLDPNTSRYKDPFTLDEWEIDSDRKKFFRLLLHKDTYFVVLCPGTDEEVAELQQRVPFPDYPFVGGEQAMRIGEHLDMILSETELQPAILAVDSDTNNVESIHVGRGPGAYFHSYLLNRLIRARCRSEVSGHEIMSYTEYIITRLQQQAIFIGHKPHALCHDAHKISAEAKDASRWRTSSHTASTLPPEIIYLILAVLDDPVSLINMTRTSRLFYVMVCDFLAINLKVKLRHLKSALPQDDGKVTSIERILSINEHLDRWVGNQEGVGIRELENRLLSLRDDNVILSQWSKRWATDQAKISTLKNSAMVSPISSAS